MEDGHPAVENIHVVRQRVKIIINQQHALRLNRADRIGVSRRGAGHRRSEKVGDIRKISQVGDGAAAIFHQQDALAARADQGERQIRNPVVTHHQADRGRGHLLGGRHVNGGVGHRVIQQHRAVGRIGIGIIHRRVDAQHGLDEHILRQRGVGVVKPHEIPAKVQRRPHGNEVARRRAVGQGRLLVIIRQGRIVPQLLIHLDRRRRHRHRHVGRVKRQVRITRRHIHIIHEPAARRHGHDHPRPRQVSMRLDEQIKPADLAGLRQGIVHRAQNPRSQRGFAAEVHQTARPVRIRRARGTIAAVVIDNRRFSEGVAKTIVVVQHHVQAVKLQHPIQVAEVLVLVQVGHDDLLYRHRHHRQRENIGHARMRVVAVRNLLRQQQAMHNLIAVLIQAAERNIGEDRQKGVFGAHPVLGLHPDIIDLARRRIREEHKFRAALG